MKKLKRGKKAAALALACAVLFLHAGEMYLKAECGDYGGMEQRLEDNVGVKMVLEADGWRDSGSYLEQEFVKSAEMGVEAENSGDHENENSSDSPDLVSDNKGDGSEQESNSVSEPGNSAENPENGAGSGTGGEAESNSGNDSSGGSEAESNTGSSSGGSEVESNTGSSSGGSEAESNSGNDSWGGSETESDFGPGSEAGSEAESNVGSETEGNSGIDGGSESGNQPGSSTGSETTVNSGNDIILDMESEPESASESESGQESESETEIESESESETEEDLSFFLDENWQDGPVRRTGASAMSRAATPTVKRDSSTILSYLEFPCYFKYVTNHGMDVGGKTVAAYCVYNTREAPESEKYEPSGKGAFSKEITYCLYNGCRYKGSTSYKSAYSTGDWKKDYYLTQIAIHVINYRQGRESSIEDYLKKSKDPEVYNLAYKMVSDAYNDSKLVSSITKQTKEVTYTIAPASQKDWVKQADGTWRTTQDYACTSNAKERIVKVTRKLEGAPAGVSLVTTDPDNNLSSFYFTATEEAYQQIGKDGLTVTATLTVTTEEYGGWWYVPADSSVKRQSITYLALEGTQMEQNPKAVAVSDHLYFNVSIVKKDAVNGRLLAGTVYGLYTDPAGTLLKATFPPTDASGASRLDGLQAEQETYYVKEITPPGGYCRDNSAYPVSPGGQQEIALELTDKEQKIALTIYKEGEVLTGAEVSESGVTFQYEMARLTGAEFVLYAAETIQDGQGQVIHPKDGVVREGLVTGNDGCVEARDLYPGAYYLIEKSAPQFMVSNGARIDVVLKPQDDVTEVTVVSTTVRNQRQKAQVKAVKQDSETKNGVDGAVFGLYAESDIKRADGAVLVNAGTLLGTAVSDREGLAVFQTDLPVGNSYVVREVKAPSGYVHNSEWTYAYAFENDPASAVREYKGICENKRYQGRIVLQKTDLETGLPVPQGDASLECAVYGVYARKTIQHPDGTKKTLYEAGQQVAVLNTDSNGRAATGPLYLGEYYVKELTPPEGYLKDEQEHDLILTEEALKNPDSNSDTVLESDGITIARTVTADEQVKKQAFQLIKVSGDGSTAPGNLAGAGFTAWLISGLKQNEDGTYDTEGASPAVIGAKGETELFTDENGWLCTIPLPYGTYLVRETTVPAEHKPVKDFIVKVTEHKPETPQPWKILIDESFAAKLKIIKKDNDSGRTVLVPGAEFRIWDYGKEEYVKQYTSYPEHKLHDSFYTNEEGCLILPENLLPGRYRIEEVKAPEGYQAAEEPVDIVLASDMAYLVEQLNGDVIVQQEIYDSPVHGVIELQKTGEKLESFGKDFSYQVCPLEGVLFEIYAEEDILSPDGNRDDMGNRQALYKKGDLVGKLVTDAKGYAISEPLPLGTYRLRETGSVPGFLLDKEGVKVTLSYQGQETAVVSETVKISNERQKVSVVVEKKDQETGAALAGAEFTLYAGEDLLDFRGAVVLKKDETAATCITGTDGRGTFSVDLPHGKYYLKETKAPAGYVDSSQVFETDLSAGQGSGTQEIPAVLEAVISCGNTPTKVEISKTDITDGNEIPGAKLAILDENGKVLEEWVSDKEPHMVERLPVGKYTLQEETAPRGYVVSEEVTFEVKDTGEIQKVVMKDKRVMGRLVIEKYDKENGTALKNAVFELKTKEGKVLETLTTDRRGEAESKLYEIGTYKEGVLQKEAVYILTEKSAPQGYLIDKTPYEIRFSCEAEPSEVIEVRKEIKNERAPGSSGSVPKTGDDTKLFPAALAMTLSAAVLLTFWFGRKRRSRKNCVHRDVEIH